MLHRFRFLGELQADGTWRLTGDEALHLSKVLRLPLGTAVEVTDGRGLWALAAVAAITGKEVALTASPAEHVAPPQLRLEFAIGALKPGAVDDILPALTELGIDHIHVFQQEDSAKARLQPKVVERWQRILVQATKQCKRSWLPELSHYESVGGLIAYGSGVAGRVMLRGAADPPLPRVLAGATGTLLVVAGGEKGLSAAEEQLLVASGYAAASLGPFVLRAVTAAVAATVAMALYREQMAGS